MSLFFVQRHINTLNQKLKQLELTAQKLNLVSQKIQTFTTTKLNSVCWADVKLRHTSEVMVNLGGGYFLQTTKDSALEIAKRRKDYIKDNVNKLQKIKQGLLSKQGIERGKGYEKRVIEKNEDGDDVFEIVEFPEEIDNEIRVDSKAVKQMEQHKHTNQRRQAKQQVKQQGKQITQVKELLKSQPVKEQKTVQDSSKINQKTTNTVGSQQQKAVSFSQPQAPKRISKFKQQREQQRKI